MRVDSESGRPGRVDDQPGPEALLDAHRARLLRLCRLLLRDPEEAKDVVQDVFMQAYAAQTQSRSPSDWAAWLTRVAINACHDRHRAGWWTRGAPRSRMGPMCVSTPHGRNMSGRPRSTLNRALHGSDRCSRNSPLPQCRLGATLWAAFLGWWIRPGGDPRADHDGPTGEQSSEGPLPPPPLSSLLTPA
jgi:hypothetical protein